MDIVLDYGALGVGSMGYVNIIDIGLNILFVSIPEQIFIVLFTLILLGKHSMFLDLNKEKLLWLGLSTVIPALVSCILRTLSDYLLNYMPFIGILVVFLCFIVVYRVKSAKERVRAFLFIIASFVIMMCIQLAFVPFIIYGTSISLDMLGKPTILTVLWSLPERAVECVLIVFLVVKRTNLLKVNLFEYLKKNSAMSVITLVVVIINIAFIYIISINVYYNRILDKLSVLNQMLILITFLILPILNISSLAAISYTLSYKSKYEKRFIKQESYALKACIDNSLKNGNIEGVKKELDSYLTFLDETDKYIL